jgi:spermidine/putrescine transport system ATP-binding protein
MVFQHLALFPMMDVGANVAYGLVQRGVPKADAVRRADAMLERVGLPGVARKRIDQLSGGQKQRVAIARALVLEPTLLLLDEPLGALDLKLREHMKVELKRLQAAFGTTFVYITHDQSEALVLSDRVAVMNHGRFEQVDAPQALYYAPRTPFVAGFVGANNRFTGRVQSVAGARVEVLGEGGLTLHAHGAAVLRAGDAAEVYVRPEAITLARQADELPADQPRYAAQVLSVLFDGAASAVLLRERQSGAEIRVALQQTGRFADLRVDEAVHFGFDPARAACFAAKAGPTDLGHGG